MEYGSAADTLRLRRQSPTCIQKRRMWRLSSTDNIHLVLFLLFAALYSFVILYKEDFAYYDDDMMTDFPLRGLPALVPIWPDERKILSVGDFVASM